MGVQLSQVVGSNVEILIGQDKEDGAVDSRVAIKSADIGLDGVGAVALDVLKRRVSDVELRDPSGELGGAGLGVGNVAVVGADGLAGLVPLEEDLAAGIRERHGAVAGDAGRARDAGRVGLGAVVVLLDVLVRGRVGIGARGLVPDIGAVDTEGVGLVQDGESGIVLPHETGVVLGAGRDVGSEESPGPGLRNADLEPLGSGEETLELAEDHLLTSLGGDGLQQHLTDVVGVEVVEEAVHAGLTVASQLLAEVDELVHVHGRVVVGALVGRRGAEHVAEESGVADLLVGHVLDQVTVLSSEAGLLEIFNREAVETPVEEIELNPFLVKSEGNGLVVEVGKHPVDGSRAVGANTASRGVRGRLRSVELAVAGVLEGVGSGGKSRDRRSQNGGGQGTGSGGWGSGVRTVGGYIGNGLDRCRDLGDREGGGGLGVDGSGSGERSGSEAEEANASREFEPGHCNWCGVC